MLTLISFILLLIGSANWLTIGLLQFDFVAGLFGSQSNIFSRIIYVLIGVGAIITSINLIKNKGKLTFNFKKLKLVKEKEEPETLAKNDEPQKANIEASHDHGKELKDISKRVSEKDRKNAN